MADSRHKYKIIVQTGNVFNAGTAAQVSITLVSSTGAKVGPVRLYKPGMNCFERSDLDDFSLTLDAIEELASIEIGHDNSGFSSSWNLASVVVENETTKKAAKFVYNDWLPTKDTKALSVTLQPVERYALSAAPSNVPQALSQVERSKSLKDRNMHRYRVIVGTTDMMFAGTDANVYLTMFSSNGEKIGPVKLHNKGQNSFEAGYYDNFQLDLPAVVDISSIEIGHDNTGPGPNWHLHSVDIRDENLKRLWRFKYDSWLPDRKTGALSATLRPYDVVNGRQAEDSLPMRAIKPAASTVRAINIDGPHEYKITTLTANKPNAGTTSNVDVTLISSDGNSVGPLRLNKTGDRCFGQGQLSTFNIKADGLADISQVQVAHDNTGSFPLWGLDTIAVEDHTMRKGYVFKHDDWVPNPSPEYSYVTLKPYDRYPLLHEYKVTTTTSTVRNADTKATVMIKLITPDGKRIGPARLYKPGVETFNKGATDTFLLEMEPTDSIVGVEIGHDSKGDAPFWHLATASIENLTTRKGWRFRHNEWIPYPDTEECMVELTPYDQYNLPPLDKNVYKVMTLTSKNVPNAGTDCNVSCIFVTPEGREVGAIDLAKDGEKCFEAGKLSTFAIEAAPTSDLAALKIGHDASGPIPLWHLDGVAVENWSTRQGYRFKHQGWVPGYPDDASVTLKPYDSYDLPPLTHDYTITTTTTSMPEAGTDAEVQVAFICKNGQVVGPAKLMKPGQQCHGDGQTSTFRCTMDACEDLQAIQIGHDMSGAGPCWHLANAKVENETTRQGYLFRHDDWIPAPDPNLRFVRLSPPEKYNLPPLPRNMYRITTVTSSGVRRAGTESDVTIFLYTKDGRKVGPARLYKPNEASFADGQTSTFDVEMEATDELDGISIGHDNLGPQPIWHLATVTVENHTMRRGYRFKWHEWVPYPGTYPKEGMHVDLKPHEAYLLPALPQNSYRITTVTSAARQAGTDSNVAISLLTSNGRRIGPTRLAKEGVAAFSAGRTSTFNVQMESCEEIAAVEIGHDGSGKAPEWLLDSVTVENEETRKGYRFTHGQYIPLPNKNAAVVELRPYETYGLTPNKHTLKITTVTTDKARAGTEANVQVMLIGPRGQKTGPLRLYKLGQQCFDDGQVSTFTVESDPVDDIASINIGHDNSGSGPAWHLSSCTIENVTSRKGYKFEHNDWIPHPDTVEFYVELKPKETYNL